ncbi:hypothetical protein OPV22_024458 [Ensete ventricosum]|uniref:non-specific serine/threonine protein kinase n=1 Tax=Ensete ventricosum TaxID=4639 RepID=A0AAV8P7E6_ENSVE|nr:hypothetical protein OPV22_024458 [Ensete ventricosum]
MSSAPPPDVSSSTSINSSSSSSSFSSSSSVSPPPLKSPDASPPPTDIPTPPDKSTPSPPPSSKDSSPSLESDDGSSSTPSSSPLPASLLRPSRSSSSPVTPSSKSLVHADSTHDSGGSTPADSFSNSTEVSHSDMNLPLIIGVAAGLGLLFLLMVIACVCCSTKKKKKEKNKGHNAMQYYSDPSGYKDSDYYGGGLPQKWHNGDHDRMLVYEFVANKTLEYHLHAKGLSVMDWPTRLKIALGSARGLAYLHEDCHPRIIHRDIKSANILLDLKFEAMVADFGLAKLSSDNHTHVSTRVMGTFGYLAPEYASSGKLTEKSDVFSYGVMLLEIITGRRPVDTHTFMEDSLVDWARPVLSRALADGDYDELADPRLDGNYDPMEMARMVACAAASVRHSARRRPKMSQIVRALEGDVSLEDLNEGMRPGQSMLFSSGSDYESNSYTSSMNRLRKVMIASPEYSGAYDGPITEFEHCLSASSSGGFSGDLNPIGKQRHF